jgi:hypothetical protein
MEAMADAEEAEESGHLDDNLAVALHHYSGNRGTSFWESCITLSLDVHHQRCLHPIALRCTQSGEISYCRDG